MYKQGELIVLTDKLLKPSMYFKIKLKTYSTKIRHLMDYLSRA